MQKIAICVSGGGTNLQAIIDAVANGTIRDTKIELVVSNKKEAYALERAAKAGIETACICPKIMLTGKHLAKKWFVFLTSMRSI